MYMLLRIIEHGAAQIFVSALVHLMDEFDPLARASISGGVLVVLAIVRAQLREK